MDKKDFYKYSFIILFVFAIFSIVFSYILIVRNTYSAQTEYLVEQSTLNIANQISFDKNHDIHNAFNEDKTVIVVFDKDYKVVYSNIEEFPVGINLSEHRYNKIVNDILSHAEQSDTSGFKYKHEKHRGICSVAKIPHKDGYVLQMIYPSSLKTATTKIRISLIFTFVFSGLFIVVFIFYLQYRIRHVLNDKDIQAEKIINALSNTYENVFIINSITHEMRIFHIDDFVENRYGKSFDKNMYEINHNNYMNSSVFEDDKKLFSQIDTVEKITKKLKNKNTFNFIYRIYVNDQIHYIKCNFFKVDDGIHYIMAYQNVDDMAVNNQIEDSIKTLNESIQSVQWRIDFDMNSRIKRCYWSDGYRRLLGYNDISDFPNAFESFTDSIHPDDRNRVLTNFWESVNDISDKKIYDAVFQMKTKQGDYKSFHVAGQISRRKDKTPIMFIGILVDIDEQIQLQNKLKEAVEDKQFQFEMLNSISKIYLTMHLIDLKNDSMIEYNTVDEVRVCVNQEHNVTEQMESAMLSTVYPELMAKALAFTDLRTIPERMKGKRIITCDLNGPYRGWFRASFITVRCDEEQKPEVVLFATQVINDEKQREELLVSNANTDELTQCFNRRAYRNDIHIYQKEPIEDNLVYVSLDVNGLKFVNDKYGHLAGDELLRGAASCMQDCFAKYGKVYRIGGDEFCALILCDEKTLKKVQQRFDELVEVWSSKSVKRMAISAGYVQRKERKKATIDEIAILADKRMYKNKKEYYEQNGFDRRGRKAND